MPTKAVLWDIDGTFALTEDLHFESLCAVSERYNVTVDETLKQRLIGLSAVDVYNILCTDHAMVVDFATWANERYHYYLEHAASIEPRPGALAVWHTIAKRKIAQALVSNSDRLLVSINIAQLGLDRPQLTSVARNDVRNGKPAAEPYLRAAYLLAIDPVDCVAVEDTPTGASAALAAGMKTVVWPEDFDLVFPESAHIIQSIDQLLDHLEDE